MKAITLRYFDVSYSGLTTTGSVVPKLISKLSSAASSRLMPINKTDSDKSDLISDFLNTTDKKIIAGTSLRIVNSREVPIITEDMLMQNQFKVSTINTNVKDKEKTCLDYFYFCLNDSKLIVTLDSRTSINRFETYINWLLNTADSGDHISFTPTVDEEKVSVADLKKITINNSSVLAQEESISDNSVGSKLVSLRNDVLKILFAESDSLEDLMKENICSAELVIKFSKPKGMDDEVYKSKTIGTILKPLEDPDSIKFQANGKKIKGSSMLKNEVVEIEDADGAISEQEVYQQMIKRLK